MTTPISFYNYTGKPNDVPKSLSLIKTIQVEFITEKRSQLDFVLELDDIDTTNFGEFTEANYLSFKVSASPSLANVNSRTFYYFINKIVYNFGRQFIYCHLDVLQTYWDDIKESDFLVERANVRPNIVYVDTNLVQSAERETKSIYANRGSVGAGGLVTYSNSFEDPVLVGSSKTISFFNPPSTESVNVTTLKESPLSIYEVDALNMNLATTAICNPLFLQAIIEYFSGNPGDAVISAHAYPFYMPSSTFDMVNEDIKAFGKVLNAGFTGSSVAKGRRIRRAGEIGAGSFDLSAYRNDFLYYPPSVDFKVFLPFVGVVSVDPTPYMSHGQLDINYYISPVGGETYITFSEGGRVHDTFQAVIGVNIPTVNTNIRDKYAGLTAGLIGSVAGMVGGGGSTSRTNSSSFQNTGSQGVEFAGGEAFAGEKRTGKMAAVGWSDSSFSKSEKVSTTTTEFQSSPGSAISHSIFSSIYGGSLRRNISGSLSGDAMERLREYNYTKLYISVPKTTDRDNWSKKYGNIDMTTRKLDSVPVGFVKLYDPLLNMENMTMDIYKELYSILTSGFYKV